MTSHAPSLLITQSALDDMIDAGREALPNETGGILAGFRDGERVVVTRVALVPDRSSTRRDYRLRHRQAGRQLDRLRAASTTDVLGYVGDWHTHPADAPASDLDYNSLATIASASHDLVVLVVLPFAAGQPLPPHVLVARSAHKGRGGRRRVDLSTAQVIVSSTMSHELEASADAACQPKEE